MMWSMMTLVAVVAGRNEQFAAGLSDRELNGHQFASM
jgi:hypothetical protein